MIRMSKLDTIRARRHSSFTEIQPDPVGWQPQSSAEVTAAPHPVMLLGPTQVFGPQHSWESACCEVREHRTTWVLVGRVHGIYPSHTLNKALEILALFQTAQYIRSRNNKSSF